VLKQQCYITHTAALPTLPSRIRRCCPAAAATAVAVLPPPPPLCRRLHCCPVTLLPRCLLPLSCRRRRHRPHHADASAALPAVATPLPRCLRRSANAATMPPTLLQRCGQDVLPAGAIALQDWRSARGFYWPKLKKNHRAFVVCTMLRCQEGEIRNLANVRALPKGGSMP
jgi:hypothetical protein